MQSKMVIPKLLPPPHHPISNTTPKTMTSATKLMPAIESRHTIMIRDIESPDMVLGVHMRIARNRGRK